MYDSVLNLASSARSVASVPNKSKVYDVFVAVINVEDDWNLEGGTRVNGAH